jgi:plastocyanin
MSARRKAVAIVAGGLIAAIAGPLPVAGHPGHSSIPVSVGLQSFSPARVDVIAGDTVVWTWAGPVTNHSVTSDPGQSERFDSDPNRTPSHSTGDTYLHTFTDTGTFSYHCKVHAGMRGQVVVSDPYPPLIYGVSVRPRSTCSGKGCDRPKLRITSDEPGTLLGRIERKTGGGWKPVRALARAKLKAAQNTIALPTKGLDEGAYRVAVRARDGAGNRSLEATAAFRIKGSAG